ncbi:MAG TPA: hypothetical protein VFL91_15245 [Thermomicrobiales bacterium]|nr:hypothetical protein [Thermomicrobiales bacterium]
MSEKRQPIYVEQMLEPVGYTDTMGHFIRLVREADALAAAREKALEGPTRECPICQGSGYITEDTYDEQGEMIDWDDYPCWRCDGIGHIPEAEPDEPE